jgi:PII-like signaling protein
LESLGTTGKLLRIFVDEEDRWHGKPLFTAVVDALREAGFAGATVLKGIEGYGSHGSVHSARVFDFSSNLPILIEVFEEEDKIVAFIPTLRKMVAEGLITLETVRLLHVSHGNV